MNAARMRAWVERPLFQHTITGVILINALVLGLLTRQAMDVQTIKLLDTVDTVCLSFFVLEMIMKMRAYGMRGYFTSGWNIFDFSIVMVALMPTSGSLSVLRALRIFRVMRLISIIPSMRRVVQGMLFAMPGVASVGGLLLILFYISAVMATNLFGRGFPAWFGDLGSSMYTLFQIMTLESWSMGIVRPVMELYPYAWLFFIPFIMVTTFTVLNLFIGIIVDALAITKEQEESEEGKAKYTSLTQTLSRLGPRLERMEEQLASIDARLAQQENIPLNKQEQSSTIQRDL
uniref:Putative ion transport protein n=1 Tax=Magnetococcus massalia (strain MO-1) TaxID=451514 RepID=A0A1S7LFS6_MAGMO|nr:putative ion transport protein [Candidatus Magnetococcus massalia]